MLDSCVRWGLYRRRSISYCRAGVVWRYQDLVRCGGVLNVSSFECIFSLVSSLYHLHPSACHHVLLLQIRTDSSKKIQFTKISIFFLKEHSSVRIGFRPHPRGCLFANIQLCLQQWGRWTEAKTLNPHECGLGIFSNSFEPTTQGLSPQCGKVEASKISVTFCWLKFCRYASS